MMANYFRPASSGGGGGGGGVTLNWLKTGGNSPTQDVYSNDTVYLFDDGLTQELYSVFRVPEFYSGGTQLSLKAVYTSPSAANTVLFTTQSTLIKKDTTAFDSTTNQRTSTNSAATNSATANRVNEITCDLTDSTGNINSVAVAAGDIIKVRIYRGTGTDTAQVRLHTNMYEVTLA